MKAAVVGTSGYIAGYLLDNIPWNGAPVRIGRSADDDLRLDLADADSFDYRQLKGIDFIIFTAAVSSPDTCAKNFEYCWDVNVRGTQRFIEGAIEQGCNVIFFSSDAVFGDHPNEIFTEISETRADTPYGKMKKHIEDHFRTNGHFKAIRLSYVVSRSDRFVTYCRSCIQSGSVAEVFHPFYRNCITVSDVTDTVTWLMDHWEELDSPVLNLAGGELVSRVRIADEINRALGNGLSYRIVRPEGDFYRNRPAIAQMESMFLQRYSIVPAGSFTEKFRTEFGGIL